MVNKTGQQLYKQQIEFHGWEAYEIGNGLIRLVAVPDIGGRVMAYDLGEYDFLFVDRDLSGKVFDPEENQGDGSLAGWKNYGGEKTWPSPQGWENNDQWAGPPDSILDSGLYQLDDFKVTAETASIKMTSPLGSPTGVQIIRQVTIHPGSSRVMLDLSFRNISQRKIRWSIWDVVQLQAEHRSPEGILTPETDCVVTAPLNPFSRFDQGYKVMFGDLHNPQWKADQQAGMFFGEYQWEIGKVGLDSRAGWVAFANKTLQQVFTARYAAFPDEEYPDLGAGVEFWTVGRGKVANLDYEQSQIYLMELEILSPFQQIEPDQAASFQIEWGACRCPGPILDVTEGGCASQKLRAWREADSIKLTGSFGVFDLGSLKVEWLDLAEKVLEVNDLGKVSPLRPVLLDFTNSFLKEASRAQLKVISKSTEFVLASATIS